MAPVSTRASHFGRALRHYEAGGIRLLDYLYHPDRAMPPHRHDTAQFYLVLDGITTEAYDGVDRTCEPSIVYFHPAGVEHATRYPSSGTRIFSIELSAERLQSITPYGGVPDRPVVVGRGYPTLLALRIYDELRDADLASPLAIEGLVLEMLAEATRLARVEANPGAPRWLQKARDLLHARFMDSPSPEEIATTVGVHPARLSRTFRRHFGCTMGEYARRLRLEFAQHQLGCTERPISEIALDAGFADQSHFSNFFKRRVGMTAGEFRSASRPRRAGSNRVRGMQDAAPRG